MKLNKIPISNLMSDFVSTIQNNDTIGFALLNMVRNRFRRLPVVDDEKLVGILTSTDLLRAIDKANSIEILEHQVVEIMSSDVVSGHSEEEFRIILQRMAKQNVSCIPLISEDKVIGVFTNKDLMLFNIFWRELPSYTITSETPGIIKYNQDFCIQDHDTIQTAIKKLIATDVKELLLLNEDGENIGLISTQRVLRSITSTLIREGLNMSYLDRKVITRIVADPIIHESLPVKLDDCRIIMNKRGIDSLILEDNGEYQHILTESAIKNLAWKLLSEEK